VAKELAVEEIGVLVVESPVGSVEIVSERDVVAVMAIGGDVGREQVETVMLVDLVDTVHKRLHRRIRPATGSAGA
jgi:hypothetical protein